MSWCRHPVFVALCGSWMLLGAWESGAAEEAAQDRGTVGESVYAGRKVLLWQPVSAAATGPVVDSAASTPAENAAFRDPFGDHLVKKRVEAAPVQFGVVESGVPGNRGVVVGGGAQPVDGYEAEVYGPTPGTGYILEEPGYPGGPWTPLGNLMLFAGVHGFKGPTDLGLSGNFGFHEGVNWGAPLLWGYGYQVGFQALHSNFAGNQAVAGGMLPNFDSADRNQVFFTAGFFKRPPGNGWQTGMAFDLFYDNYFDNSLLYQLRSETAYVLRDLHEIGYWGAYGISQDTVSGMGQFDSVLNPTDMFAAFYRRRFTGGGQGRLWAGLSGNGDVIFGLDGTVPLGTNWALDNNFTCLFPKNGRSAGGGPEESWSVSIQLVWYPGRPASPTVANPFHPLFYVADNSWFLVDRRN